MELTSHQASAPVGDLAPAWKRWAVLLVGLLLLLSCFAHGILGWSMVRTALVDARTPIDLIDTLAIGWRFGSAAMAAFGVIVLVAWSGMRPPRAAWGISPGLVIATTYILFGLGALVASRFDTHFLIFFLLPGLVLFTGLWRRR